MDRKSNRGKLRVPKCNNTKDEIYELRALAQKSSTQRAKAEQELIEKGFWLESQYSKDTH